MAVRRIPQLSERQLGALARINKSIDGSLLTDVLKGLNQNISDRLRTLKGDDLIQEQGAGQIIDEVINQLEMSTDLYNQLMNRAHIRPRTF